MHSGCATLWQYQPIEQNIFVNTILQNMLALTTFERKTSLLHHSRRRRISRETTRHYPSHPQLLDGEGDETAYRLRAVTLAPGRHTDPVPQLSTRVFALHVDQTH